MEDDDDQAFLLRRQMRDQLAGGLDMVRVGSLREALVELGNRSVRCVMLDLSLPDASGMEALTAIRAASPDVAVVVLTGTDNDDVGRQALALGAQDYLVKGQHGPDVVRRSVVFSLERAKRQAAEQERADVAHRLELVLETSAEGICTIDGDGAISFLNRTAMELFGVADDQLVGTPLHDFHVCSEDPCPLERQLMTRQVLDAGEQAFRSPRGLITLEVRSRPVHESGTGIGGVVCLSDVTDRRRALDALAEREAQLVEAQQLAHLGSWEWVPGADEMVWSDQMYRITGLDAEDVRGGRRAIASYLALVPEEERDEVGQLFDGWTTDRAPVEVVHQLCRPDHVTRWMLCRANVRQTGGPRGQGSALRVVGSVQDITEQKLSEDTLAYQAMHDGLTGLPNRALLRDRLERMLGERQRDMVALVYMDIDDFKWVNDNLSHAAGDELLVGVAERLGNLIRPTDTLARNSGDEFIMVCDRLPDVDTVTHVVDRLQESLAEP
ncbi:diguanylate cyclase domain-containing protein, partial [Nocardioides sp.]|uniref:two-component system response regulator n=1 Tax=Nocardioides sp. TaxID=35761 RepID=UPI003564D84C